MLIFFSITVTYGGQQNPNLPHNENWSRNEYAKFYHDFIEVRRSIGLLNPGLSMKEYKNLFTVYCIDLSAHPQVSSTSQITIAVTKKMYLLMLMLQHKIEVLKNILFM